MSISIELQTLAEESELTLKAVGPPGNLSFFLDDKKNRLVASSIFPATIKECIRAYDIGRMGAYEASCETAVQQ